MAAFYYIVIACFGLAVGSFLNALVWRIHKGIRIAYGRSQCTSCAQQIVWYDNIPLVSFILLRGKCRACKKKISAQYPIVEGTVCTVFVFWMYMQQSIGFSVERIATLIILSFLVFIFVYDARYKEIHTASTVYPAIAWFSFSAFVGMQQWHSMLIGILVAAGFFFLQYVVSKGRWIGGGDVRYGVLMGVLLGWPLVLVGLFISYILGALISIVQVAIGKKKLASETPFGTYLVIGTFAAMLWGQQMLDWYLSLVF